jgi:replicative DNA helicase
MENSPENIRDNTRKRVRKTALSTVVSDHGRVPPQAVDLEEAVLGALMLEKDALTAVIDILKPEIFYKDTHQIIFTAIQNLFKKSEPVDILTLTNELRTMGELDTIGGPYYLTQLTNRVASAANIEYHVRIISQKYIQRELIHISSEIIKDAFEDTTDVFDLLDKAERNLFAVSESNLRRSYLELRGLVKEAISEIEAAKNSEGMLKGVGSGFTEIDRVTAGWQKSDLIVLASRPGMGKTAFVLSMARNMAVDFKKPVAFFSLEMSAIQLVTRLISSECEIPADKLRRGNLENAEWEQLNARIRQLVDAPLFIDDTPALSIFELRAKSRRLKAQHDIQMVIIDYLQLMSISSDGRGNREQEISQISRSLKALAKELDIPIIALSQLSRAVETRGGNKKPILSDLRESGAIEQDADLVLFIYRPEYYKIDEWEDGTPTAGSAEIIIAKHRNGALKDVKLRFIGHFAKFTDLDTLSIQFDEGLEPNQEFTKFITRPSRMDDVPDENPF